MAVPIRVSRKFGDDAYKMLPGFWRSEDHDPLDIVTGIGTTETLKFHHRLMRAFGGNCDSILDVVRGTMLWLDPVSVPLDIAAHLASNVGWPMDPNIPESVQRLIIGSVTRLVYSKKGNLKNIGTAIRAFTGIQCELWAPNNDPRNIELMRRVGPILSASGPGSPQGQGTAIRTTLLLASVSTAVSAGDTVIANVGGQAVYCSVIDAAGTSISVEGRLSGLSVDGGELFIVSTGIERPGRLRFGLGSGRLAHSQAPNYVRLDHDSPNTMLTGSAMLAPSRGCASVSDFERAMRFTFYVKVPFTSEVVPGWKLRMIRLLANYMKPSRTHCIIRFGSSSAHDILFRAGASALNMGNRLE